MNIDINNIYKYIRENFYGELYKYNISINEKIIYDNYFYMRQRHSILKHRLLLFKMKSNEYIEHNINIILSLNNTSEDYAKVMCSDIINTLVSMYKFNMYYKFKDNTKWNCIENYISNCKYKVDYYLEKYNIELKNIEESCFDNNIYMSNTELWEDMYV